MNTENDNATSEPHPRALSDSALVAGQTDDPNELFEIGNCHAYGKGCSVNIHQALNLWQQAATKGCSEAMYSLGTAHLLGDGVPQSKTRALKWLLLAHSCDHRKAKELLHDMKTVFTADELEEGFRLIEEWSENPEARLR